MPKPDMTKPDMTRAATFDAIPEAALGFYTAGHGAALATVIETWGSAPRPAGSQLAVSGRGEIVGSVSGGCVEGAVILEAQDAIESGGHRILTYGVSDDNAFAAGLACGGTIRILVAPIVAAAPGLEVTALEALVAARARRGKVAQLTDLETGAHRLIETAQDAGGAAGAGLFAQGQAGEADGTFLAPHLPPLRLIVVGAVHIAQALVPMAELAGFDVALIDPRPVFAAADRFPGRRIGEDWPDAALEALAPDGRTAIVTLTHDPKLDDPALEVALRSPAFYIASLGSTRTHAKRLARLGEAGFAPETLARIHGPAGARIGAKTPAEIAVSVLAELIATLRAG